MNDKADILIVTVTEVESRAVMKVFREATGKDSKPEPIGNRVYLNLGEVNGSRVFMALSGMGTGGVDGSQEDVRKGIEALSPSAVIMVGIAFGINEKKQAIGDVLISERLMLYDLQRVGTDREGNLEIIPRGDRPHASPWLINIFQVAKLVWDESKAKVKFGLVLSGDKLVDNIDFRRQLLKFEPEAVGGEMEGDGLYVACQNSKVDWVLVKAICDWADGQKPKDKDAHQQLAANNAANFVLHALNQAPFKRDRELYQQKEAERLPKPKPPRKRTSFFVDRYNRRGYPLKQLIIEALKQRNIVSLWGRGGVGKTTLAIEVAHELAGRFDGIIWIGLETYDDFSLPQLLNEICIQLKREDALTLRTDAKKGIVKSLLDSGNYLLILDNFEIVKDKGAIIAFLSGLSCNVLITTIENVSDIHNIEILQMTTSEAENFISWLIQESSNPRWVRHINIKQVIKIAEGNPMLIQWVVGQLQFAIQPEQVFREMESGIGEATRRVFGRSFLLLSEKAQEVLLSLSIFRAGASNKALTQICEIENSSLTNSCLAELRKLKLLEQTNSSERISLSGLTHNLAKAQLRIDKHSDRIKRNFISFFLAFVEANSEEKPESFSILETEKDNITAAIELSFRLQEWQTVIRFWKSASMFLWVRGYWDEYIACDQLTLEAAKKIKNQEVMATVLSEIGWVLIDRADYEKATELVQHAHDIFTELGNQQWCSTTLIYLGIAKYRSGFLEEAENYYKTAMEIAQQEGLTDRIGIIRNYLGSLYRKRGDSQKARQEYEQSLAILEKDNDVNHLMATLRNLGDLEFQEGNLVKSREYYKKGLDTANRFSKKDMIAGLSYKLAEVEEKEGNSQTALNLATLAELYFRELKMGKDRKLTQELIDRLK